MLGLIAGCIIMIIMGGLCYGDNAASYAYCASIGNAGRLGLVVAGAVVLAILTISFILHCLCCILTCGKC